eukprot:comp23166_c0_seq1/m.58389 comp23166_c0_seq1/g.58389  ORF comp23166_c0_seq1/g.58389 comp23166_c0_seq1/m.58389 type:complete len:596 (+) comp23166_c0_seq1:26-1813(+)
MAEEEPKIIQFKEGAKGGDGSDSDDGFDEQTVEHNAVSISDSKLVDMKETITKTKFGKISAVSAFLRASASCNFFTCKQVADIIGVTTFAEERVDAIKILSRKIVDPENIFLLYPLISTDAEKSALSDAFGLSLDEINAGIAAAQAGTEAPRKKKVKKHKPLPVPEPEPAPAEVAPPSELDLAEAANNAQVTEQLVADKKKRVTIFVTDPTKVGDGLSSHISYLFSTMTENKDYKQAGGVGVRRRFNDIVWLHETLTYYYPSVIVPEVPEKQVKGRFDPVFIEERRRVLERFINRCGSHPLLCTSPALRIFLEANEDEWASAQKASKAELKADKKADKKDHAAKAKGLDPSKDMIEYDTAYDKYIAIRDYILVAENQFYLVKKQLKLVVKQHEDMSTLTQKLGVLFQDIVPAEALHGSLSQALEATAKAMSAGISRVHALYAEVEKISLLDPIREYLGLFDGAKDMLTNRLTALKNYQKAAAEVSSSATKLAKLKDEVEKKMRSKGANDKDNQKVAEAQASHQEKEALMEKRKTEFLDFDRRMLIELKRFHMEKAYDFREILLDYCKSQYEATQKAASVWTSLQEPIRKALIERP